MTLNKYKTNLRVYEKGIGEYDVWSYETHVASINGNTLTQHGYWSQTTQKHVNYAAKEFGCTTILKPID